MPLSSSSSSPSFSFVTSETICASAPGKVILFGEHAVVYGHPAIASALSDLRIVVCLTPLLHDDDDNNNDKNDVIHIVLPDLPTPVDITIALEVLLVDMLLPTTTTTTTLWPVPPQPTTTANNIANCVRESFAGLSDLQQTAIVPILYLMKIILFNNNKNENNPDKDDNKDVASSLHHHYHGWHVYVSSQNLPVGAGLGSSAAFSVALAAALLRCHHGRIPDLDVVNQYAYYAETLLHGHPSGLDNAVSTYGGALRFTKHNNNNDNDDDDKGAIHLQRLPQFTQLDMLLVHTHVPRSTKALVAHVRTLYNAHPTVVQAMLRAMGEIAQAFGQQQQQQQGENVNGVSFSSRQQLLDWVRFNHALLRAVGVSHESLEGIVDLVHQVSHGRAAAKLTGAGGGGCALVVGDTKDILNVVQQALPKEYTCFSSTVGGPGVQWHDDPTAVLPPLKKKSPSWWWLNTCNDKKWTAIVVTTFVVAATMSAAAFVRKRT